MSEQAIVLCPGQGAQALGMGQAWCEVNEAAKATFAEADDFLGDSLGAPLSKICFRGPEDRVTATNVAQPAIYTCSVACFRALEERDGPMNLRATAGLSLGEYTALHLAGVFSFADGLRLVARRGELMQQASEAADSGMVALTGADEEQAEELCRRAAEGQVLVPANFNSPGQVVVSGDAAACDRAVGVAEEMGLRATALTVAGAFHSPLMQSAADAMAEALAGTPFQSPNIEVWANVTARPHDPQDVELLKRRLVEQIIRPVKWAQLCQDLAADDTIAVHELAPGKVLKGLMRRINRKVKVINHDQP
ncbi:MAG: ACP S-malonyltransferase [Phycisphaerales bacterium]|nr:MAG: ACP S-malonyltransferase [Phycisphaerales bacterium]